MIHSDRRMIHQINHASLLVSGTLFHASPFPHDIRSLVGKALCDQDRGIGEPVPEGQETRPESP